MNTLHLTDCMEYMKDKPDNAFDLAIVDPPYGIGQGGGNNYTRTKETRSLKHNSKNTVIQARNYKDYGDSKSPDKKYFQELFRISKNQIIWGANHFISKIPFDSSCWIVWDKDNTGHFADCELAWTAFKTAVRKIKYRWNGLLQENMKNRENRIHPNQKPVALYKWLLTNYAKPGDKLFDSHSGSGSFRIAAHDLGFDLVSCELDPDYYRDNEARYQNHIKQGSLFDSQEIQQLVYEQGEL